MNISTYPSGTTTNYNPWSEPIRVNVIENIDSIEFIYKETSMVVFTTHPSPPREERVFKIVFSCVNGKWNKSDRIYGKIISAIDECYDF